MACTKQAIIKYQGNPKILQIKVQLFKPSHYLFFGWHGNIEF
jgi:hypothetical protein